MTHSSRPPDSIDLGWDEDDDEPRPPSERKEKSEVRPATDMRATIPPPMSSNAYVEEMMKQAPESEAGFRRFGRQTMETLLEEDPLQWDKPQIAEPPPQNVSSLRELKERITPKAVPAQRPPSNVTSDAEDDALDRAFRELDPQTPEGARVIVASGAPPEERISAVPVSQESPQIETAEEFLDDDDPQIARNTPPVPPPLTLDDLDELPVDEVLHSVSLRPGALASGPLLPTAPPPAHPQRTHDLTEDFAKAGLRFGGVRMETAHEFAETTDGDVEDQNFRATMPGDPPPSVQVAVAVRTAMKESPSSNPPADLGAPDPIDEVLELFEIGSYNTALDMAEAILQKDPEHEAAKKCVASCQELLLEVYLQKLGDRAWVLKLLIEPNDVYGLGLDHRAGFLVSLIDGAMSIDEVLDVSSMPPFDAARMLCDLKSRGVIVAEPPSARS